MPAATSRAPSPTRNGDARERSLSALSLPTGWAGAADRPPTLVHSHGVPGDPRQGASIRALSAAPGTDGSRRQVVSPGEPSGRDFGGAGDAPSSGAVVAGNLVTNQVEIVPPMTPKERDEPAASGTPRKTRHSGSRWSTPGPRGRRHRPSPSPWSSRPRVTLTRPPSTTPDHDSGTYPPAPDSRAQATFHAKPRPEGPLGGCSRAW